MHAHDASHRRRRPRRAVLTGAPQRKRPRPASVCGRQGTGLPLHLRQRSGPAGRALAYEQAVWTGRQQLDARRMRPAVRPRPPREGGWPVLPLVEPGMLHRCVHAIKGPAAASSGSHTHRARPDARTPARPTHVPPAPTKRRLGAHRSSLVAQAARCARLPPAAPSHSPGARRTRTRSGFARGTATRHSHRRCRERRGA